MIEINVPGNDMVSEKFSNFDAFLACHFLVHLSLSLLRVTALNRKAKSGQKNIEFFDRSFF